MLKYGSQLVGVTLCLVLTGCGAPLDGDGSEPVGTQAEALTVTTQTWTITGGGPNKTLTPYASSLCALTSISGTFANVGGWTTTVDVYMGGSNWLLQSNPQYDANNPLFAAARCITGLSSSKKEGPHIWHHGEPAVDMGSASSTRVCFLTSIYGKYNGDGEQVRVRIANDRWILDGTAGDNEDYKIGGRAYCLTGYQRSPEWSISPEFYGLEEVFSDSVYVPNSNQSDFCALSRVRGKFDAPEDWINARASSDGWRLSGTSSPSHISGRMRCTQLYN